MSQQVKFNQKIKRVHHKSNINVIIRNSHWHYLIGRNIDGRNISSNKGKSFFSWSTNVIILMGENLSGEFSSGEIIRRAKFS